MSVTTMMVSTSAIPVPTTPFRATPQVLSIATNGYFKPDKIVEQVTTSVTVTSVASPSIISTTTLFLATMQVTTPLAFT